MVVCTGGAKWKTAIKRPEKQERQMTWNELLPFCIIGGRMVRRGPGFSLHETVTREAIHLGYSFLFSLLGLERRFYCLTANDLLCLMIFYCLPVRPFSSTVISSFWEVNWDDNLTTSTEAQQASSFWWCLSRDRKTWQERTQINDRM